MTSGFKVHTPQEELKYANIQPVFTLRQDCLKIRFKKKKTNQNIFFHETFYYSCFSSTRLRGCEVLTKSLSVTVTVENEGNNIFSKVSVINSCTYIKYVNDNYPQRVNETYYTSEK